MNKIAIPFIAVFAVLGALLTITSIMQTFLFGPVVVATIIAAIGALIAAVIYEIYTSLTKAKRPSG